MSILDEIGYYDEREEGELTPSPSDEDEEPAVTWNKKLPIGIGNLSIDMYRRRRVRSKGTVLSTIDEYIVPRSIVPRLSMEEEELRLRLVALSTMRKS